jgi:hypothetical protein
MRIARYALIGRLSSSSSNIRKDLLTKQLSCGSGCDACPEHDLSHRTKLIVESVVPPPARLPIKPFLRGGSALARLYSLVALNLIGKPPALPGDS